MQSQSRRYVYLSPAGLARCALAALLTVILITAAGIGFQAAAAGDGLIPYDLPDENNDPSDDGDLVALIAAFEAVSAPPPPVEAFVIGTLDASTGVFTWGPAVQRHFDLSRFITMHEVFDVRNIRVTMPDLAPHISSLNDLGRAIHIHAPEIRNFNRPDPSTPPARNRPGVTEDPGNRGTRGVPGGRSGSGGAPYTTGGGGSGGGGDAGGDPPPQGHSSETVTMHIPVMAAKVGMVFNVVNRQPNDVVNLRVQNRTREAVADEIDLLCPPRAWADFEITCGGRTFADRIHFDRPPMIGCFVLEALPVGLVYEPPGEHSAQTYSTEFQIGTVITSFSSEESSEAHPVDTMFSRVGDMIDLLNSVGAVVANAYPAVGAGMQGAAGVLEAAWGNSHTEETITHTVTDEHSLEVRLTNSEETGTALHMGPGQGDVITYLRRPVFAWLVAQDDHTGGVYVTMSLLGYIPGDVSAYDLRTHPPGQLSAAMCTALLEHDPMTPEYRAAASVNRGRLPGGIGGRLGGGSGAASSGAGGSSNPAPQRFVPATPFERDYGTVKKTLAFEREITESDAQSRTRVHTVTTTEQAGFLSYVSSNVPQDGQSVVRSSQGQAAKEYVSETIRVELELGTGPDEPVQTVNVYYDTLYGTFAVVPVEATSMVSGAITSDSGEPASNIDVMIETADGLVTATTTDEQGRYTFRSGILTPGDHTLVVGTKRFPLRYEGRALEQVDRSVPADAIANSASSGSSRPTRSGRGGSGGSGSGRGGTGGSGGGLDTLPPVDVRASETADTAGAIRGRPGAENRDGALGEEDIRVLQEIVARLEAMEARAAALLDRVTAAETALIGPPAPPASEPQGAAAEVGPAFEVVANPEMRGRMGRIVVEFPEGTEPDSYTRILRGEASEAAASHHGGFTAELLPGDYALTINGAGVEGVPVQSAHDTRMHVGVLRLHAPGGAYIGIFSSADPEAAILTRHGSADVGLPVGRYQVEIAGVREDVVIRSGQITEF